MKKFLFLMVCALLALTSCKDIFGPEENTDDNGGGGKTPEEVRWQKKGDFQVGAEEIVFPSFGGMREVEVKYTGEWFSASPQNVSWLTVRYEGEPMKGHKAYLVAEPYSGYEDRTADVLFFDGNDDVITVTVKQTCKSNDDPDAVDETPLYLLVNMSGVSEGETTAKVSRYAGSVTFYVNTNADSWEEESSADWMSSRMMGGDAFNIDLTANEAPESRTGTVTVTARKGDKTATWTGTIIQNENYTPPAYEDNVDFAVYDNVVFVGEDRLEGIKSADAASGTVTFSSTGAKIPDPGQVLVVPHVTEDLPEGLLGRVTSVTETPDGVVCSYEPCPIQEAFRSIDIQETEIDLGPYVKEIRDASGRPVAFSRRMQTRGTSQQTCHIDLPGITVRNVEQTVLANISAGLDLGLKFSLQTDRQGLHYFGAVVEPKFEMNIGLEANVQTDLVKSSYPLITVLCGAFPVGPVVITPLVEISFILGADGKIAMKTALKYKNSAKMRYVYQFPVGSDFVADFEGETPKEGVLSIEEGKLEFEGGIYAGFDTSVGLGLYGTIIYGTVGVQETLRCSGNAEMGISEWVQRMVDSSFGRWGWDSQVTFSTDFVLQGVAAIKSLGTTLAEIKSADSKENIDKLCLVPKMRCELVSQSLGTATIRTYFTENLLTPAFIGLHVYAKRPGADAFTEEGTFPMGTFSRVDPVTAVTDPVTGLSCQAVTTTIPLYLEGVQYCVKPYARVLGYELIDYPGNFDPFYITPYQPLFISSSTADGGFRGVLMDLMPHLKCDNSSARLENWGTDTPLNNWQGVLVTQNKDGSMEMYVNPNTLSEDHWYPTGDICISSHTGGMNARWTYDFTRDNSSCALPQTSSLVIEDPGCESFDGVGTLTRSISVKSDKFQNLGDFSTATALEELTLGGKFPGTEGTLTLDYPKLRKLSLTGLDGVTKVSVRNNTELESTSIDSPSIIRFELYDCDYSKRNLLTISDMKGVKYIVFENFYDKQTCPAKIVYKNLPALIDANMYKCGDLVPALEFINCFSGGEVELNNSGINGLGYGYHQMASNSVSFTGCGMETLTISSLSQGCSVFPKVLSLKECPKLKNIDIEGHELHESTKMDSFSMEQCPAVERLKVAEVRLESFSLDGPPTRLNHIDLRTNHLTGEVPALFDEIKSMTGESNCGWYDHKYEYGDGGTLLRTNTYGFWYSGEPERRYHYTKENPNGDDFMNYWD